MLWSLKPALTAAFSGLTGADLQEACSAWIEAMDLTSHRRKQTRNLSGGNQPPQPTPF